MMPEQKQRQQQPDQAAQVVKVVLQQLPDWDIKIICSLLQVSTAVRTAVYESGTSCEVSADLRTPGPDSKVSTVRLAQFCGWLPGHASLVHKLLLESPKGQAGFAAAQQLVLLALQLCAHQTTAALGHPAQHQVSGTGLVRPLQLLQLKSLDSRLVLPPAAFTSLAAGSCLTQLLLRGLPDNQPSAEALCSLATLTSLRHLQIERGLKGPMPGSWAAVLSQLTYLHFIGPVQAADFQLLPAQLVGLRVEVDNRSEQADVTLQHMTDLEDLSINCFWRKVVRASLPTSLVGLTAIGPLDIVPELPRLCELTVGPRHVQSLGLLSHLPSLSALRSLEITLIGLSQGAGGEQLLAGAGDAVMAAVSKASQVTDLRLHRGKFESYVPPAAQDHAFLLHAGLSCLTQLYELAVTGFRVQPPDMLRLTCLSRLTGLAILACSDLGDMAAASLACKLTRLQRLQLCGCGLGSPVLLPALASCTLLRELDVEGNNIPLTDDTLMLLTSLRQLTRLVLTAEGEGVSTVTAVGLQQFKAAMPARLEMEIDVV